MAYGILAMRENLRVVRVMGRPRGNNNATKNLVVATRRIGRTVRFRMDGVIECVVGPGRMFAIQTQKLCVPQ